MHSIPVARLDMLCRFTPSHFAIRDAVADLEAAWGHPPRVPAIAERVGLAEPHVRRLLAELAAVGYLLWRPADDTASRCTGLPLLGEIE